MVEDCLAVDTIHKRWVKHHVVSVNRTKLEYVLLCDIMGVILWVSCYES